MSEDKAYKRAELRSILVSVPIKAVVSALLTISDSSSDGSFFSKLVLFIVVYSILSIYAYVSKMVGNWILGAIVIVVALLIFDGMNPPDVVRNIVEILFVGGGFTIDVYRIIKYIRLSVPEKESVVLVPDTPVSESIAEQPSGDTL